GLVEDGLASDGRHADAVAVVADAGDGSTEVVIGLRESQAVQDRDRPRTHRDDVAEDSPNPGRGTLEGLDGRRVIVGLDLEGHGLPVPEIDHARVLTGTLEDTFSLRGKSLQQEGRMLVPAVL